MTVLGFYCLSFCSKSEEYVSDDQYKSIYKASGGAPFVYIHYLAVLRSCQRNGLGTVLLMNALERSIRVAENVAFYGVALRPINEDAARLYRRLGFEAAGKAEPNPLMILPIWSVAELFDIKL